MYFTLVTAQWQAQQLWGVTFRSVICGAVSMDLSAWHFKGLFCLQLQGQAVQDEGKQIVQNVRNHAPRKTPSHPTQLDSSCTQKHTIISYTASLFMHPETHHQIPHSFTLHAPRNIPSHPTQLHSSYTQQHTITS